MPGIGDLAEIGRAGAVFAAEAQTFDDARQRQNRRRRQADGLIGRRRRDDQRAEAHAEHRNRQRYPPAVAVGDEAEQPAAERPHQEGGGEQHRRVELLHHRIGVREERGREIQRESGVGVEIVPFDEIADRADENRLDAPLDIADVDVVARRRCGLISHTGTPRTCCRCSAALKQRKSTQGRPSTRLTPGQFPRRGKTGVDACLWIAEATAPVRAASGSAGR